MKEFYVLTLGVEATYPSANSITSSNLLVYYNKKFLLDCGEGTQMLLRKYKVSLQKINHIFISHLHGDHYFGIFGLLSTFNILNRKHDLNIYCHYQLKQIIDLIFKDNLLYKINFHFYPKEFSLIYEDEDIQVFSCPLNHNIENSAIIFKEKNEILKIKKEKIVEYNLSIDDIKKIKMGEDYYDKKTNKIIPNAELTYPRPESRIFTYLPDTIINDELVNFLNGTTTLLCDSTFLSEHSDLAEKYYHNTCKNAALLAKKLSAKLLILTHFSSRYRNRKVFLSESKEIFENTILAEEGKIIQIL